MKRTFGLFPLMAFYLSACASNPVVYLGAGDSINLSALTDQNGHPYSHEQSTKLTLYVNSMDAKNLVEGALGAVNDQCLKNGTVTYVANISGMPSIISKLVALPDMRKLPYPIWLDSNGAATRALPVKEDQVTLLTMDHQVITDVDYVDNQDILIQRLTDICGAANKLKS